MKSFKPGDKVRFIDEGAHLKFGPSFFPPVGTIGDVLSYDDEHIYVVQFPEPCGRALVYDYRLELVQPYHDKILIMRDKKDPMRVIARYLGTNKTAEARCNPQDTFKFEAGARLALGRLLGGTEPPEEKEPTAKFKVGDVVIGNEMAGAYYAMKPGWIGYVIDVLPDMGCIRVREKKNAREYEVVDVCFDHYHPVFKKGDRVRMRDPERFNCHGWATDQIMTVKEYLPASDTYLMEENSYAFAPCWLVKAPGWNGQFTPVWGVPPWLTPGKIYKVKDGVVRDDFGDSRYGTLETPIESFAELQSRVSFKILEIKD